MDLSRYLKNQWDRAAAVVAVAIGAVALVLGYLGVSRSTLATQQIPYLASGGLFGVFALGIGATLWLSADLRDEWRKLDSIQTDIRAQSDASARADERAHAEVQAGAEPPAPAPSPNHVAPPAASRRRGAGR